MPWTDLNLQQY